MIDFVKFFFNDYSLVKSRLENGSYNQFNPESKHSIVTGESLNTTRMRVENLDFRVTKQQAFIQNSIHKFLNMRIYDKNVNYDQFSFCSLLNSLAILECALDYPLSDTKPTILEFGLNIHVDKNPTDFLEDNLIMGKLKTPCYDPKNDDTKKIKKFIYNDYEIKVYNKSLQYDLEYSDILRVEIKYKSRPMLSKLGVKSMDNLRDVEVIKNLYSDFIKKIDTLNIIDCFDCISPFYISDYNKYKLYTNSQYWINLSKEKSTSTYNRKKHDFERLLIKYDLLNEKKSLIKSLNEEFDQLIIDDCFNSIEKVA